MTPEEEEFLSKLNRLAAKPQPQPQDQEDEQPEPEVARVARDQEATASDTEEVTEALQRVRNHLERTEGKWDLQDSDLAILWLPAINTRFSREILSTGKEKVSDGGEPQESLDGLRAHVADVILQDVHRIPPPAFIGRVIHVWRMFGTKLVAGSLYVRTEEARFAQVFADHFVKRPGGKVPAASLSGTIKSALSSGGALSPHLHHRFKLWLVSQGMPYRRNAHERWYEGFVSIWAEEKAEAEALTGDKGEATPPPPVIPDPQPMTSDKAEATSPSPVTPEQDRLYERYTAWCVGTGRTPLTKSLFLDEAAKRQQKAPPPVTDDKADGPVTPPVTSEAPEPPATADPVVARVARDQEATPAPEPVQEPALPDNDFATFVCRLSDRKIVFVYPQGWWEYVDGRGREAA